MGRILARKYCPSFITIDLILSLWVYFFVCVTFLTCFHCLHCFCPCFPPTSLKGALFTHARQLTRTCPIWTIRNVPNSHTQTHAHPSWKEVTPGYFDFIWLLSSLPMRLPASQPHTQHFSYDFTYRLGKITPLYTMSAKSGVPSSCFGHRWLKDMSYKERVCAVMRGVYTRS